MSSIHSVGWAALRKMWFLASNHSDNDRTVNGSSPYKIIETRKFDTLNKPLRA